MYYYYIIITVDSRYLELGYLENPAISNSNQFPLPLFFSHLLSAISNSSLSRAVFLSPWEFEIAGVYCIQFWRSLSTRSFLLTTRLARENKCDNIVVLVSIVAFSKQ